MASSIFPNITFRDPLQPIRKRIISTLKDLYHVSAENDSQIEFMQGEEEFVDSYPHGWSLVIIILSGMVPYMVTALDDTVVATILPILVAEFKVPRDIGWYASSYFLPMTVMMPIYGKSYTLWRLKPVFILALLILVGGSVASAAAKSSAVFIAGRAIAGVGAAGILTGAFRIIMLAVPRKKRTFLEGLGAIIMGACSMLGPLLGGIIADSIGWRWTFWINAPIAAVCIVVAFLVFPAENPRTNLFTLPLYQKLKRLDPIGGVLIVTALTCFICALQIASTSDWGSSKVITLIVVAAVLQVLFILHEMFTALEVSLLPRELLKHRTVWASCLGLFLLFSNFINFVFFLSYFFQAVQGKSAQTSAIHLLPYVLGTCIGSTIAAVGVFKIRYYNPFFIVGGACIVAGSALITFTFTIDTTITKWFSYEILLGIGVGFCIIANVVPGQTLLREEYHSIANGLTFLSSMLGASVSMPVSSAIFNKLLSKKIIALGLPVEFAAAILHDPSRVHTDVPAYLLPQVLDAMMAVIKKTYIFGLSCGVATAIVFFFIPWNPLLSTTQDESQERDHELGTLNTSVNSTAINVSIQIATQNEVQNQHLDMGVNNIVLKDSMATLKESIAATEKETEIEGQIQNQDRRTSVHSVALNEPELDEPEPNPEKNEQDY
ncbi:MFS general substrate transporter [Lepidopterella palustris CBS 459.81]|uniref:MFS general substrate transporter n=1 Tax=Lepidopterella palustris CBS 459.81 TaxID=1314670 RepID=A0A8E2E4G0_9PEZI|nr:MFS general substrate transporter [Lepidopterella palustris CBS 459.81]